MFASFAATVARCDSILKGEFAENEFRKDFTPSERVAIGEALEVELGARQGQRTDKQLQENFPEVQKGQTRDLVAKATGFGNGKTYQQANQVAQLAQDAHVLDVEQVEQVHEQVDRLCRYKRPPYLVERYELNELTNFQQAPPRGRQQQVRGARVF